MRICFFVSEYPNLHSGGVEKVTAELINSLNDLGHELYVIYLMDHTYNECIKVTRSIQLNNGTDTEVLNFIKNNKIDIIINQSHHQISQNFLQKYKNDISAKLIKVLHTDPLAPLKGVTDTQPLFTKNGFNRFIWYINPINIVRKQRRRKYIREEYTNWCYLYDKVVLLSNNSISDFKKYCNAIDINDKVCAIPNSLEFLKKSDINTKKKKQILFVGRLHREAKRPDRLLKIWEKIYFRNPDWELFILGDGPLKAELERYVLERGIHNITFCGQTDPRPYFRNASILCVTSTYEGFSMVIIEALRDGAIPIAFKSFPALNEMIKNHKTGFTVKPYSIPEYTNILEKVMRDEELRGQILTNIREDKAFFDRYSRQSVLKMWIDLFNQLISK